MEGTAFAQVRLLREENPVRVGQDPEAQKPRQVAQHGGRPAPTGSGTNFSKFQRKVFAVQKRLTSQNWAIQEVFFISSKDCCVFFQHGQFWQGFPFLGVNASNEALPGACYSAEILSLHCVYVCVWCVCLSVCLFHLEPCPAECADILSLQGLLYGHVAIYGQ